MNNLKLLKHYFQWAFKAKNLHGVHSPFLYDFMRNCLYKDEIKPEFQRIEAIRKKLLNDKKNLSYTDHGAGNRIKSGHINANNPITRSVAQIARSSLKPPKTCRLFSRIPAYFDFQNVLEMGTSFGITTSYISCAKDNIAIETIEGAAPIAQIARKTFSDLGFTHIKLREGLFDHVLPQLLRENPCFDMVYIDGDHKGESLLRYFSHIVKHIHGDSVVIVDDIRWSVSMHNAWLRIIAENEITLSVDLFDCGLLFFKENLSKEHYAIKF